MERHTRRAGSSDPPACATPTPSRSPLRQMSHPHVCGDEVVRFRFTGPIHVRFQGERAASAPHPVFDLTPKPVGFPLHHATLLWPKIFSESKPNRLSLCKVNAQTKIIVHSQVQRVPRPLLVHGHWCRPIPAHGGHEERRAGWEPEKDGAERGKLQGEHGAIRRLTVLGKFGGAHES